MSAQSLNSYVAGRAVIVHRNKCGSAKREHSRCCHGVLSLQHGISEDRMRLDRVTLSLRGTMHKHPKLRLGGGRRRGKRSSTRVSVFQRAAASTGGHSKGCKMRCGSHDTLHV